MQFLIVMKWMQMCILIRNQGKVMFYGFDLFCFFVGIRML